MRPEAAGDHDAVERVVREAFAASEFGHQGEAELVAELRDEPGAISLVAEDGGEVCGHILFTPAAIESEAGTTSGWALAPMAVLPGRQREGIGSALVEAGLSRARARGSSAVAFVVVFGHLDYYPRFGFKPASEAGVTHAFEGLPAEPFFLLLLDPSSETSFPGGTARYLPAFGPQG